MMRLIIVILAFLCLLQKLLMGAEPPYPVKLQWDYDTNALFQVDWTQGFLLTTNKTATVTASAGTNTYIVAATVNGVQSLPSNVLTVLVMRAELQFSTNMTSWSTVDTNHYEITNNFGNGFYRVKLFWPTP